ncbi:MAG: hypothetical protein IPJ88_13950 [Myxococcales bacterium]|nr:MAG: hypothetical protein IPJ88_13950 [Myxococcales bacterium]
MRRIIALLFARVERGGSVSGICERFFEVSLASAYVLGAPPQTPMYHRRRSCGRARSQENLEKSLFF